MDDYVGAHVKTMAGIFLSCLNLFKLLQILQNHSSAAIIIYMYAVYYYTSMLNFIFLASDKPTFCTMVYGSKAYRPNAHLLDIPHALINITL